MIRVGVGMMPMVVAVTMTVLMNEIMVVMVTSAHRNRDSIWLTGTRAFPFTETAGFRESLNVVMMAGLIESDFLLKPQDLSPVLAERAIHGGFTAHHFLNPLKERVENEAVIAQIGRVDEINFGMIIRNTFRVLADPAHQNPGKQEIRENNDALEAKLHHMTKTGFNQWEGDA